MNLQIEGITDLQSFLYAMFRMMIDLQKYFDMIFVGLIKDLEKVSS